VIDFVTKTVTRTRSKYVIRKHNRTLGIYSILQGWYLFRQHKILKNSQKKIINFIVPTLGVISLLRFEIVTSHIFGNKKAVFMCLVHS
jgi:hypothetical protein